MVTGSFGGRGFFMKKTISLILIVMLVLVIAAPTFAHPNVPEVSIGKVNPNAVMGMHTAWGNVQNANGIAKHVFWMRHSPHDFD